MNDLNWLLKIKEFKGKDQVGARHHLLPNFYMESFSNSKGKVGVKNRKNGLENHNSNPGKILFEKDFYTFVNLDMESDGSVEVLISQIEAMACEVIRRRLTVFQRFPMDNEDAWALSYFVALQLLRGRRMRRIIEILADFYTKSRLSGVNESNAREFLTSAGLDPSDDEVKKLIEYKSQLPEIFIAPATNEHIQFLLMSLSPWANHFRSRPISLIKFDEPILVTSDEPILFFHKDEYIKNAIGYAEEIHFPISPQHLLIFGQIGTSDSRYMECPTSIFSGKEFNTAMFDNSHEMIIFNPDYRYLGLGKLPKNSQLIQIQASSELIPENFQENANLRKPLARFRKSKDYEKI